MPTAIFVVVTGSIANSRFAVSKFPMPQRRPQYWSRRLSLSDALSIAPTTLETRV
jgi:hypothetical protein